MLPGLLYTLHYLSLPKKTLANGWSPKTGFIPPILIKETGLVCEGPTTSKLELLVGETSRTKYGFILLRVYMSQSFMHASILCHCFLVEIKITQIVSFVIIISFSLPESVVFYRE